MSYYSNELSNMEYYHQLEILQIHHLLREDLNQPLAFRWCSLIFHSLCLPWPRSLSYELVNRL